MANYTRHFNNKATVQTQPLPLKNQIQNNAGGYVFDAGAWTQFDRFLILGSEGGTFYATEQKLTVENANNTIACIKENGPKDEFRYDIRRK